ncbi:MAG TPA: MgtC/SapB family protein [Acidimicrobiia bacterium]
MEAIVGREKIVDPLEILGRLVLAAMCSGLIGYERETARKAAGLRTHTLVGVGAAIFAIASMTSFDGPDESRIAAQIVTGVGFLGAGAIFRQGALVTGLTTAAGLWVAAAIGMSAGAGSYWLAVLGTTVTLGALYGLAEADKAIARRKMKVKSRLEVYIGDTTKLEGLFKFIRHIDPDAGQIDFKRTGEGAAVLVIACDDDKKRMLSELLASHRIVTGVKELEPRHWPQDKAQQQKYL